MTREDQLLDVFAQANPVPDPDRFEAELRSPVRLATPEQGSDSMQGTELRTIEPRNRNPRGPWVFAAAAGLVAVLAVGALLVSLNDDTTGQPLAPTTTAVPTTAAPPTTDAAPGIDEGAVDVVLASIAARNSGDLEAWAETLGGEQLAGIVAWPDLFESYMVANQVVTVVDDCVAVGTGLDGETLVSCGVRMDDDFHGAGGIFEQGNSLFHVLDGKVVEWVDGLIRNDPGDFDGAFWAWLQEAYPEEAQAIGQPDASEALETSVGMATALEYVAEFVAQSDVYPFSG